MAGSTPVSSLSLEQKARLIQRCKHEPQVFFFLCAFVFCNSTRPFEALVKVNLSMNPSSFFWAKSPVNLSQYASLLIQTWIMSNVGFVPMYCTSQYVGVGLHSLVPGNSRCLPCWYPGKQLLSRSEAHARIFQNWWDRWGSNRYIFDECVVIRWSC